MDAITDISFVDSAWASTIGKSGIPVVGGNISDSTFNTYSDFYPQGETLNSDTYATVATAKKAGAKSVAILYCTEAPTCAQSAQLDKSAAKTLGIENQRMNHKRRAPSPTTRLSVWPLSRRRLRQ